jgi:hypothetical protein
MRGYGKSYGNGMMKKKKTPMNGTRKKKATKKR